MNLSGKKYWFMLLAAVAMLLLTILLWRWGQGGDNSFRMGFAPVNDQMQQLIEDTAKGGASTNAESAQRGSKPSAAPNAAKGAGGDPLSKEASPTLVPVTDVPAKAVQSAERPKSTQSNPNQAPQSSAKPSVSQTDAAESKGKIDLNKATLEQLDSLPGIGESKAKAILAYRTEKGSFKKVEQLLEVKGIGEKLLAKIKPMLYAAQP